MASIRELSETLVLQHAKPLLKAHGYRKDGWTWSKEEGDVTRLFRVMFSKHNSRSECRFTIELDVCNDEAWRSRGGTPPKKWTSGGGMPHQNVGKIEGVSAQSWMVTPDIGVTSDHHATFEQTSMVAVEWLESFSTMRDMFDYLVKIERWVQAVPVGLALGAPEAHDMLRHAIKNVSLSPITNKPKNKKYVPFLVGLAERYGVSVP